jgi:hypothetical protein
MRCCRPCWIGRLRESCDGGEKPSTNKTTNTRMAGVAAGAPQVGNITVRCGGGVAPVLWGGRCCHPITYRRTKMNKKLHVFISYCAKDRLFASALYQELKRED